MVLKVEGLAGVASGEEDPDRLTQRNFYRGRNWLNLSCRMSRQRWML